MYSVSGDSLELEAPRPLQTAERQVRQSDGGLGPCRLPREGATVAEERDLAGGRGLHCSNGGHVVGWPLQ